MGEQGGARANKSGRIEIASREGIVRGRREGEGEDEGEGKTRAPALRAVLLDTAGCSCRDYVHERT